MARYAIHRALADILAGVLARSAWLSAWRGNKIYTADLNTNLRGWAGSAGSRLKKLVIIPTDPIRQSVSGLLYILV